MHGSFFALTRAIVSVAAVGSRGTTAHCSRHPSMSTLKDRSSQKRSDVVQSKDLKRCSTREEGKEKNRKKVGANSLKVAITPLCCGDLSNAL